MCVCVRVHIYAFVCVCTRACIHTSWASGIFCVLRGCTVYTLPSPLVGFVILISTRCLVFHLRSKSIGLYFRSMKFFFICRNMYIAKSVTINYALKHIHKIHVFQFGVHFYIHMYMYVYWAHLIVQLANSYILSLNNFTCTVSIFFFVLHVHTMFKFSS